MKKMMILAMMMVMTISARSAMPLGSSKNAMSYNAAKHNPAPIPDRGARVMNYKGHMGNHNMGNHNAHKAPNREIAQNTRNNHGGSGHFGGRR